MKLTRAVLWTIPVSLAFSGGLPFTAVAYPKFATKEKKSCMACHLSSGGGKGWGFRGLYYRGHGNSFNGFVELTEAKKAGVKPNAMGAAAKPTKPYTGLPAKK